MTSIPPPICTACARLTVGKSGTGWSCAAFPDAIPDDIAVYGFDHRHAYPGDHGIRFQLDPKEKAWLTMYEESHPPGTRGQSANVVPSQGGRHG